MRTFRIENEINSGIFVKLLLHPKAWGMIIGFGVSNDVVNDNDTKFCLNTQTTPVIFKMKRRGRYIP